MHRILLAACTLACLAQPALGGSITNLGALNQQEFRVLSEDLASALSYKPVMPAAPLGITGFDMGVEATQTSMAKSSAYWAAITSGHTPLTTLTIPKLHIAKGLPLGFDVGLVYAKVPASNISAYGMELRHAVLQGGLTQPTVSIRGALTRMRGVDQLALDTRSLDVSVSQNIAMLTPYAGLGHVWATSNPSAGAALQKTSFSQPKVFVGANLNLLFANFAAEWDKTGPERSVSLKAGFRF